MAMQPDDDDFDFEIEIEEENTSVDKPEIEVEDDTPEADRGREPMPKEIVDELEADELEEYSDKVKTRLKQMKKVWHDERREKERLMREQNEAVAIAQRLMEENKQYRQTLSQGEQSLVQSYQQSAEYERAQAQRDYKEAYETGDSDKLVEAQEKLQEANSRLSQLKNYRPTIQEDNFEVQIPQPQYDVPRPDQKTIAWQERNTWWGSDPEMTASALGLHQKLERERGPQFVGTDEYWTVIDKTMGRRFPEYFGETERQSSESSTPRQKSALVVAPASRSTSSKKVVLKQSQLVIAKKLGLTPEQYAQEFKKLEG
jgi:hypothetical protein